MTLEISGADIVGNGKKITIDGGKVVFSGQHSTEGISFSNTEIGLEAGAQVDLKGGEFRNVVFREPAVLHSNDARFTKFVEALLAVDVLESKSKLAEPFKSRCEQIVLHLQQTSMQFDVALDVLNSPASNSEEKYAAIDTLESWSGSLYQGSEHGPAVTKAEAQGFHGTEELNLMRIRLDGVMESLRVQALQVALFYKTTLELTKIQAGR